MVQFYAVMENEGDKGYPEHDSKPKSKSLCEILNALQEGVHLDWIYKEEKGVYHGKYFIGCSYPLECHDGVGAYENESTNWHVLVEGFENANPEDLPKGRKIEWEYGNGCYLLKKEITSEELQDFSDNLYEIENYTNFIYFMERLHKNSLAYKSITQNEYGSYCSLEEARKRLAAMEKQQNELIEKYVIKQT